MKEAKILYGATDLGAPQFSSDLLWRSRFRVPDPVFLVEIEDRVYLFASSLEFGRAKKESEVDEVILSEGGTAAVIRFLKSRRVRQAIIPHVFPYHVAAELEKEFKIVSKAPPFYPERMQKTVWEIAQISAAQKAATRGFELVVDFLHACRIRGAHVYDGRAIVTSERVRSLIDESLFRAGYLGINTIVASGAKAADPHAIGSGALTIRQPIVIDIFPVSLATHYYGDMTRTFFKGEPSADWQKMYEAVRQAQEQAIVEIRAGVDGQRIYRETLKFFEVQGYPTTLQTKPPEGFIHGLGHGVGVDIHEPPQLGSRRWKLETGNVVTIEPGLYYRRPRRGIPAGGIRIEDALIVRDKRGENLTRFPKDLEHAIIT